MYPPSPPSCNFQIMLGESLSHHINIENNKPSSGHHVGANLNKRQALLKKGGRRVRSSAVSLQSRLHHQQQQQQQALLRSNPARCTDINNNSTAAGAGAKKASAAPTEPVCGRAQATAIALHHHLRQGARKEALKSKTSRADRAPFPCSQSVLSLSKCDFPGQNLNAVGQKNKHSSPSEASAAKRHENTIRHKSPLLEFYRQEGKKPLNSTDNFKIVKVTTVEPILEENLKDGEKNYAGPKFTEPPSPSVLPKPPSHWVGENSPRHSDHSRALMTVHLKSLLKVQAMP